MTRHSTSAPAETLSGREREVLHLLLQGLNHYEIGAELQVARGTVDAHVANISRKLEAKGPVQLGRIATELGIL